MDAAELEEAYEVIPRDREIILFCACPNEVTAARLALLLRSKGITKIRPLAEGYEGMAQPRISHGSRERCGSAGGSVCSAGNNRSKPVNCRERLASD